MDKVEKLVEKTAKESSEKLSGGFIGHVFKFDEETRNQLFNLVQYSLLSIIPIVLLNKTIHKFIPEADDTKSNVELLAEIIGQTVILFVGMFFIHRLITYIPTYSKVCYESFNLVSIVLSFLVILLSLQSRLGEKVNIVVDRISNSFGGSKPEPQQQQKPNVVVTAPISGQNGGGAPQHQPSQADQLGVATSMMPNNNMAGSEQSPDFNSMHEGGDAMMGGMVEPMAANGALGSGW
mgnify:CR=1 FL=1